MEPITTILGGIVVALISAVLGSYVGSLNNVKCFSCEERREACQALIASQLHTINEKIDNLTKAVNSKLLGI